MVRALLLDMDGLMVDTEPFYWEVAHRLAREHGKRIGDSSLRKMMGRSRIEAMQILIDEAGIGGTTPEELLARREALLIDRYRAGVEPMAGLLDLLRRFHGLLKLAVVTSAPQAFADVLLPGIGVSGYFDVVQTGEAIARSKPDPLIYQLAIEQLNVRPEECVVLEDSSAGVASGHAAGAFVIAVPSSLTVNEAFPQADARVVNLREAQEVIEALIAQARE